MSRKVRDQAETDKLPAVMPWLTNNVFIQSPGEALDEIHTQANREPDSLPIGRNGKVRARRFVHVMNPFTPKPDTPQAKTQDITYRTMVAARDFAQSRGIDVEVVAACFRDDRDRLPDIFDRSFTIERSTRDLTGFQVPRHLPFLFDVLAGAMAACDTSDYVIYTNLDICLMPYFYETVTSLIDGGVETMTINRRTIPEYDLDPANLPLMYSDYGKPHIGYDCFAFPARLFDEMVHCDACLGAGFVDRSLLFNLIALSRCYLMIRDEHLTFHLGDDREWASADQKDYRQYNRAEALKVYRALAEDPHKRDPLLKYSRFANEEFILREAGDKAVVNLLAKLKHRFLIS